MSKLNLDKVKNRGEAPEWVIRKDNKELIKEVESLRRMMRILMGCTSMSQLRRISVQLRESPGGDKAFEV